MGWPLGGLCFELELRSVHAVSEEMDLGFTDFGVLFYILETGFYHIAQADFELMSSLLPQPPEY